MVSHCLSRVVGRTGGLRGSGRARVFQSHEICSVFHHAKATFLLTVVLHALYHTVGCFLLQVGYCRGFCVLGGCGRVGKLYLDGVVA